MKAQDARPGLTRRLTWHKIGGFRQPLTASSLHLPWFEWLRMTQNDSEWLRMTQNDSYVDNCWHFRNTELEFLDAPGFIPVGFGRRFTKDRSWILLNLASLSDFTGILRSSRCFYACAESLVKRPVIWMSHSHDDTDIDRNELLVSAILHTIAHCLWLWYIRIYDMPPLFQ